MENFSWYYFFNSFLCTAMFCTHSHDIDTFLCLSGLKIYSAWVQLELSCEMKYVQLQMYM